MPRPRGDFETNVQTSILYFNSLHLQNGDNYPLTSLGNQSPATRSVEQTFSCAYCAVLKPQPELFRTFSGWVQDSYIHMEGHFSNTSLVAPVPLTVMSSHFSWPDEILLLFRPFSLWYWGLKTEEHFSIKIYFSVYNLENQDLLYCL